MADDYIATGLQPDDPDPEGVDAYGMLPLIAEIPDDDRDEDDEDEADREDRPSYPIYPQAFPQAMYQFPRPPVSASGKDNDDSDEEPPLVSPSSIEITVPKGPDPKQWPYDFDVDPRSKPPVVAVVDVPQPTAVNVSLFGGKDDYVAALNRQFELAASENFVVTHGEHGGAWVDYENQPGTGMAHMFNFAGTPWLSQKWIRVVKEKTFGDVTPMGGYNGDEDQGQMGSLGV